MRSNKKYILLLFVLIIAFSCEKVPFDYRNIYVGSYNFTTYYTEWSWVTGKYTYDTTEYDGKVVYGSSKNTIKINYNNTDVEFNISRNGDLYDIETLYKVGTTSKDTLNWGYTIQTNGNYRSWVNVIGVKER